VVDLVGEAADERGSKKAAADERGLTRISEINRGVERSFDKGFRRSAFEPWTVSDEEKSI
jgi:hypothetical protein